jgi:hypothetical protein
VPSIQVKDVPAEVHATLRKRAAAAGQSLQEYLLARLVAEATQPTIEEVLERAGQRASGRITTRDAVRAVRAERDSRGSSSMRACWSSRSRATGRMAVATGTG